MEAQRSATQTILLVDDSASDRVAFARYFANDPLGRFRCAEVATITEALAYCKTSRPALVLLDYDLPDGTGIELLTELINEHGPHAFGMIILTGQVNTQLVVKALRLGAHDYLIKMPGMAEQLFAAAENALIKVGLQRQVEQQRHALELRNQRLEHTLVTLEAERARLAVTLTSIGDAVITTDINDKITLLNPEAERLTGWRNHEALALPLNEVFVVMDRSTGQLLPHPRPLEYHGDKVLVARNGTPWPIDENLAPIQASDGTLLGHVVVFRDMAKQRHAEEQLSNERLHLHTLINTIPDMIWLKDTEGKYLQANTAFCSFLGVDESELIGKHDTDFFSKALADGYRQHDLLALTTQASIVNEETAQTDVSQEIHLETIKTALLSSSGKPLGVLGIAHDITDRKKSEAQMALLTELLQVLSDISHRFAINTYDKHNLFDEASRKIATVLECACMIAVLDAPTGMLQPQTLHGPEALAAAVHGLFPHFSWSMAELTLGRAMVLSSQPVLLADFAKWSQQLPSAEQRRVLGEAQIGSVVLAPLRLREQVFGAIVLARRVDAPAFNEFDRDFGQELADRVALALSNAQLYSALLQANSELEERVAKRTADLATANTALEAQISQSIELAHQLRQQAKRTEMQANLSRSLADTSRELQPLFQVITEEVSHLFGDACIISLLSEDSSEIKVVASKHPNNVISPHFEQLTSTALNHMQQPWTRHVLQTGTALYLPFVSVRELKQQIHPHFLPLLRSVEGLSLAVVPLRVREHVFGTLALIRTRLSQPYTEDDTSLLQDLADRAALAIENARLFHDAQQSRDTAEQANRAKSAFLSSMSHELRTPLNAIIGFTATLMMRLPGPLNSAQEKQLSTVRRSAQHLLALINDILDLARIESGKVSIQLEPVVCQQVFQDVATALQPLASEKGLALELVMPEEPLEITSDQRTLNQILLNLVGNAIKFTDQGSVQLVLEPPLASQKQVSIHVIDTGIGIKDEDRARLFQEFGRVDSAEVRAREGTGLGLRLVSHLTTLVGGSIEVQSEYGVGSRFSLFLPCDVLAA